MASKSELAVREFMKAAKVVLGSNRVFNSIQRPLSGGDLEFPSLVFLIVGEGIVDTYGANHTDTTFIRYDLRADDPCELYDLDARLGHQLHLARLVVTDSGAIDSFEDALGVYRRIRTITVRV